MPAFLRVKSKNTNTRGFTVVEMLLVMGIIAVLFAIVSISLSGMIPKANLNSSADTAIVDVRQQQLKAMYSETEGTTPSEFGIHFENSTYTLFKGNTYAAADPTNTPNDLGAGIQFSTTFANSQVVFNRKSGEILNFVPGNNTVTINDTITNKQTVLTFNKYGVVESIN